ERSAPRRHPRWIGPRVQRRVARREGGSPATGAHPEQHPRLHAARGQVSQERRSGKARPARRPPVPRRPAARPGPPTAAPAPVRRPPPRGGGGGAPPATPPLPAPLARADAALGRGGTGPRREGIRRAARLGVGRWLQLGRLLPRALPP